MMSVKKVGLIMSVILLVSSNILRQLHSIQNPIMTSNDSLLSTLGKIKVVLQSQKCSFNILRFKNSAYNLLYTISLSQNFCQYIIINNKGQILTNLDEKLITLPQKQYFSTFVTITQVGQVWFFGLKLSNKYGYFQTQSFKLQKNQFQHSPNIVIIINQNMSNISFSYSNKKKWFFQLQNNDLTISKQSQSRSMKLDIWYGDAGGLYDKYMRIIPFAKFSHSLIGLMRHNLSIPIEIHGPFSIIFDQFRPIVRIFDSLHLISEYSLNSQDLPSNLGFYCPLDTFQYEENCLSKCPVHYYHQILYNAGICVLFCQKKFNVENMMCESAEKFIGNNLNTTEMHQCIQKQGQMKNPLGCHCSNQLYFDRYKTLKCVQKCSQGHYGYNGTCMKCGANCISCQLDQQAQKFLKCSQCQPNYISINSICVFKNSINCLQPCKECEGQQCIKCPPFYFLYNSRCILKCNKNQIDVASCFAQKDNFSQCPLGCTLCHNSSFCLSCAPSHFLFITVSFSSCRLFNAFYHCSSPYYQYRDKENVCHISDILKLSMGNCFMQQCQICIKNNPYVCLKCYSPNLMHQNKCIIQCPQGYTADHLGCIKKINNCQKQKIDLIFDVARIDEQIVMNSSIYNLQTYNEIQPGNQPSGYQIYAKYTQHQLNTSQMRLKTVYIRYIPQCQRCKKGYGLIFNQSTCQPCPNKCSYCYYSFNQKCSDKENVVNQTSNKMIDENQNQTINEINQEKNEMNKTNNTKDSIYNITNQTNETNRGTEKKQRIENNQTNKQFNQIDIQKNQTDQSKKSQEIEEQDKKSNPDNNIDECEIYQFIDKDGKCRESCLMNQIPTLNSNKEKIFCVDQQNAENGNSLSIMSTVESFKDNQFLFTFIFSEPIKNSESKRMLQTLNSNCVISLNSPYKLQNNQILSIVDHSPFMILNITNVKEFQSQSGARLASSTFGVKKGKTFMDKVKKQGLIILSGVLSMSLLIIHCIYVGNGILYKVDNALIFIQTLFYFITIRLNSLQLCQYLWGWSYSFGGFMPNIFQEYPNNYKEYNTIPITLKYYFGNDNLIHNAGGTIFVYLILIVSWLIGTSTIYVLHTYFNRDLWNYKFHKNILIAISEFGWINLFYWSFASLYYREIKINLDSILSLFLIIIAIIYSIVRIMFNLIGGIYMIKKITIAIIMIGVSSNKYFGCFLVGFQLFFMFIRFLTENNKINIQKYIIVIQTILFIIVYILLIFTQNILVIGIFLSIFVYFIEFILILDFIPLYFQSVNCYYNLQTIDNQKQFQMQKLKKQYSCNQYKKNKNSHLIIPTSTQRALAFN